MSDNKIVEEVSLNLFSSDGEENRRNHVDLLKIEQVEEEENKRNFKLESGKKKKIFENVVVRGGIDEEMQEVNRSENLTPDKNYRSNQSSRQNTDKKSPRKKTKTQLADSNAKLTDIFIVESPSKPLESKIKKESAKKNYKSVRTEEKIESPKIRKEKVKKEKKVKESKAKKEKKIKVEKEEEKQISDVTYINLEELNSQDKISNTEMILAILEICLNSLKYELREKNKTREFWKLVSEKPEWKNILSKFQPETLRKYWRLINNSANGNFNHLVELLSNNSKNLNNPNVKLLPIINSISAYFISEDNSFEHYMRRLIPGIKEKNIKGETQMLTYKRKRQGEEGIITSESKQSVSKSQKKSEKKLEKEEKKILESLDEKEAKVIEEIVLSFVDNFEGKSEEEVLEVLKNTSFNIENAYLYLTDPNYFRELGYVEPDDKIIIRLERSYAFKKLLQLKGKDSIEERKKFLVLK